MSASPSAAAVAAEPTRLESLGQAVARALPEQLPPGPNTCGELTYEAAAEGLLEAALVLRDDPELKFEMCMDVCGVDYLEHGLAEWKTQDATSSGFSRGVSRWVVAPDGTAAARAGGGVLRSFITCCRSRSINACGCGCFVPTTPSPWWIRWPVSGPGSIGSNA